MSIQKLIAIRAERACISEKFQSMLAGHPRVETGAIQFNDDWPGLFIRGDQCIDLLTRLDYAIKYLHGYVPFDKQEIWFHLALKGLEGVKDMIQNDVLIKPSGNLKDQTP